MIRLYLVNEGRHDVIVIVLIRSRRTADQLVGFPPLETDSKTRDQDHLQHFSLQFLQQQ